MTLEGSGQDKACVNPYITSVLSFNTSLLFLTWQLVVLDLVYNQSNKQLVENSVLG